MSSQLEFQKSIFCLKKSVLFIDSAVWFGALIFLIFCNSLASNPMLLLGLLTGFIACTGLAVFHFKMATSEAAQNRYIEPARAKYFDPQFFVFSGGILSMFALVLFALFCYNGVINYAI